jgi:striatin 1/3/4
MKSRIAKLEGDKRKLDTSHGSLKKYVNMLEKALKERDRQLKALKMGNNDTEASSESAKEGKEAEEVPGLRRGLILEL